MLSLWILYSVESKEDVDSAIDSAVDCEKVIDANTVVHLSKCVNADHYFHSECIGRWLDEKGKCSHCQKRYAIETGNQPPGRLDWAFMNESCSGYPKCNTIRVIFEFRGGIQGQEHYHPGQPYDGDYREGLCPFVDSFCMFIHRISGLLLIIFVDD